jgi:hypothetical protein
MNITLLYINILIMTLLYLFIFAIISYFGVGNVEIRFGLFYIGGVKPHSLYILEDHGQGSNTQLSLLHLLPKFCPFPISWCLLYLSMRFIGVLDDLIDPGTTSGVYLPTGPPRRYS